MRLTAEEEAPLRRGASPLRTYNDASLSRLLDGLPGMPQSILDVGCGRGHYVEFFRRHGLSGRYLGIDVVPGADWERYAATPSPLEASYRCGPIETVPLPEGAFDLVLSSSALEHVEDDRQAVRRIFAATRPGGLRLHLVPGLRSHLLFGYHGYRRYGAGGLTALFRDAGFEILALHRQGGGVSFLLHMLAIGILESGRTRGVLHDRARRPVAGAGLPAMADRAAPPRPAPGHLRGASQGSRPPRPAGSRSDQRLCHPGPPTLSRPAGAARGRGAGPPPHRRRRDLGRQARRAPPGSPARRRRR
ncbi:class I SAM-dependent methyltransferase [Azospirillum brasilense]|uniref:class I SAM-dependent methyltransferase n=1 Tax=Azospirillum brasilense TaxID=192 RepID=UPI0003A258DB|nr:class I SAM-dependent methyltransferase [Azospirillum brasilense]